MVKWLRFLIIAGLTACLCGQGLPSLAQLPQAVRVEQRLAQVTPAQLVQQGREQYAAGQYVAAIATWQQAAQRYETQGDTINQASILSNMGLAHLRLGNYEEVEDAIATARNQLNNSPNSSYGQRVFAQVINADAQLSMAQGQLNDALTQLDQTANIYQDLDDTTGLLRTQLNRAQILQVQGRYREASQQLETIAETLDTVSDPAIKAAGLRRLANTQRLNGKTDDALKSLDASRQLAEASGNTTELSSTLLSLGNLLAESGDSLLQGSPYGRINAYYQQAADIAPTLSLRLQAQVNLLGVQLSQATLDPDLLKEIQGQLPQLGSGRTANLIRLNLANHLIEAKSVWSAKALAEYLADTLQQAEGDSQSQSYAWGYWGHLYEINQQWDAAAEATQKARILAETSNSAIALYQWQWQLGRILAAQGNIDEAINAYEQALSTLEKLRRDLVSTNTDLQFSFRGEVEPIYRELVGLLLKSESGIAGKSSENLFKARNVIEDLQVAELVNFFRADCVVTSTTDIDKIDADAAIVYPIILDNSIEVIVGFPSESRENSFKHYTVDVDKDDFEAQLERLQRIISLRPFNEATDKIDEWVSSARSAARATVAVVPDDTSLDLNANFIAPAAQLYDWLIRPITEDPAIGDTKVLAFVLDGALRNVPMSVLYDREQSQYLIEQYAIALTPGLELIDPQPLARGQIKALVAGLSESVGGLPELPAVEVEVDAIEAQVPSEVLENEAFKIDIFQDKLTSLPFPVVHLATHGEFSSDLDKTFIQAFDGRINANQLSSMLQAGEISRDAALELLVLSACETASGDDQQAALGLAGIAVRSGARSTLATLWKVDDQGTSDLMTNFYQQLADSTLTKAEILQKAQVALIENDQYQKHPYFWAPFVLIGNWL